MAFAPQSASANHCGNAHLQAVTASAELSTPNPCNHSGQTADSSVHPRCNDLSERLAGCPDLMLFFDVLLTADMVLMLVGASIQQWQLTVRVQCHAGLHSLLDLRSRSRSAVCFL